MTSCTYDMPRSACDTSFANEEMQSIPFFQSAVANAVAKHSSIISALINKNEEGRVLGYLHR
jgi:hypothetical protein